MTTAMDDATKEKRKNERVVTVKRLFDSASSLRSAATKYKNLFSYRSMPNHEVSMIAGLLTGAVSKTSINRSEELSAGVSSILWLAFSKDKAKMLRKVQSDSHWKRVLNDTSSSRNWHPGVYDS